MKKVYSSVLSRQIIFFAVVLGMRADWILTDEERLIKRQKIEENRRLRRTIYPDSPHTDDVRLHSFIGLKNASLFLLVGMYDSKE